MNLDVLEKSLEKVIALPDEQAADQLQERMLAWDRVDRLHERSYVERGQIAREFEKRLLWTYIVDPATKEPFGSFSAWMASGQIGSRRAAFEAKRDVEQLSDVDPEDLRKIPKANIKTLLQVSSSERRSPGVIAAAKTLSKEEFVAKLEAEHPNQHIQSKEWLRVELEKDVMAKVRETVQYAIDNERAGNWAEAIEQMAATAMDEWVTEGLQRNSTCMHSGLIQ